MFENRRQTLISRSSFAARVAKSIALGGAVVLVALCIGILGYRKFANLALEDALLNASMILTGMGPVDPMKTTAGKLFASAYALFSGVAFPTTIAILLAPIVHRFLHHLHMDIEDEDTHRSHKPKPPSHLRP